MTGVDPGGHKTAPMRQGYFDIREARAVKMVAQGWDNLIALCADHKA